jgi:hypothetical protein
MDSASGDSELVLLHRQAGGVVGASPRPNPTRLAALVRPEAVERHRSLVCEQYDGCLDEALEHGWTSFTCERCELFKRPKASQTIWMTDHTLFSVST